MADKVSEASSFSLEKKKSGHNHEEVKSSARGLHVSNAAGGDIICQCSLCKAVCRKLAQYFGKLAQQILWIGLWRKDAFSW